jgi:carboxylesterase type B
MDVPKNKSEDCLYLEVFAPPVGKFSEPAAIILWFHGGDWHEGGESFEIYNGAHHAAHLNTMVVITNYRLVALGFLLPHPKCGDANVGILDQRMAIKWIHDNAAFFGADPNKLTLAGQSAGGESVLIHLSNPQNEVASMFHAAISESGPLPMNFKYETCGRYRFVFQFICRYLPEARTLGRSFSVELGCFSPDDCACFQSKNTSQVLKASNNVINVPLSVSDAIQQCNKTDECVYCCFKFF